MLASEERQSHLSVLLSVTIVMYAEFFVTV